LETTNSIFLLSSNNCEIDLSTKHRVSFKRCINKSDVRPHL